MPELDERIKTTVAEIAQKQRRVGVEAAFRATVEERLRNLERDVTDVKSRLNGLMLFIASTVLAQVLLRLA
jgi:septal ring factor EnvC (AmiA/AmiB activator)